MSKVDQSEGDRGSISRRTFVRAGGAALAGGTALGGTPRLAAATTPDTLFPSPANGTGRIAGYRTLGRTGWQASEFGLGTVPLRDSSVLRYAVDKGVNYVDTAEGYGNGQVERTIGEALQHIDRSKVFINTKLRVGPDDTKETILTRARASLDRMQTDYLDSFGMHAPSTIAALGNEAFHEAVAELKAEGRLRFTSVSYHGPGGRSGQSMADVLSAAAEDGRFDLMLLIYNFLNHEEADRILAACKANNVGTTAMKTAPGVLTYDPVDPENLTESQSSFVDRMVDRGQTRERALEQLRARAERSRDAYERTRPFVERYGILTEEQLRLGSFHWAIQNPDVHCACVHLPDFETVDKVVALSGTPLNPAEEGLLEELSSALQSQYCRHGCNTCVSDCPHGVPVSTIMRYAYYYRGQGSEKLAMQKYAGIGGTDASICQTCDAPCAGACPHGIEIQAQMLQAHSLLTLV